MADSQTICPFCNDTILIPEEFFGSEVECPSCHKQFFIPKVAEEESVGSIDSPAMGEFDCPLCGGKNLITENFSGKMKCKCCQKEIEVINESLVPCPHCGKLIAPEDTTCMFCQRSPSDPVQKQPEEKAVPDMEKKTDPAAKTSKHAPLSLSDLKDSAENDELDHIDNEDKYILNTLQRSKRMAIIMFCLVFVLCIISAVIAVIAGKPEGLIAALLLILIAGMISAVSYFTSSYRHGIYKNMVRIRIAAEKMSGSQE